METHPKKRIDLIIEAPLMRRIAARFDEAGVSGYSVLPVAGGRGQSGSWSADDQAGEAGRMLAIVCIVDPNRVDAVLDAVFGVVERQIGLVTISDVAVVRAERF